MGFFGKLFKKNWRSFATRGDSYLESGELGLALQEYRSADKHFDGDEEERAALDKKMGKIASELRKGHLKRARQLIGVSQWESAEGALESAMMHSKLPEEEREVQQLHAQMVGKRDGLIVEEVEEVGDPELLTQENYLILLGGLPGAQAKHYKTLGETFRDGWLKLQEGHFGEAESLLCKAREDVGDDPYLLCELSRAHFGQDHLDEADKLMRQADEGAEADIYIKLKRVEVLWSRKDFETAEAVLQAAHDLDQENTDVFRAIGEHALHSGDYEPGIEAIDMMLEDDPNNIALIRMLAQLHHAKGDLDAALGSYEQVNALRWSLDPDSHELVFDVTSALGAAQILLDQEKKPNRIVELMSALVTVTQGESKASVYMGLARAHELRKKPKEARTALERGLSILPKGDSPLRDEIHKRLSALESE